MTNMTVEQLKKESDHYKSEMQRYAYLREVCDAMLRAACEHTVLLEAPEEPSRSGLFDPMPAMRICEGCGLEEELEHRWSSYKTLTGRAYPEPKRHEMYKHRRESRAVVVGGQIRVYSVTRWVLNEKIIAGEPCGIEIYSAKGTFCAKVAGHTTYPCEA